MATALTVALPVHNSEANLAESVTNMLEVASELARSVRVIVIDDGSTDDTFEVASELSLRYPQVASIRLSNSAGLSEIIAAAKQHALPGLLCVHDGSSETCAEDLVAIWQRCNKGDANRQSRRASDRAKHRFSFVSDSYDELERAHRRLLGYQVERVPDGRAARAEVGSGQPVDSGSRRHGGGAPPITTTPGFGGEVVAN